MFSGIPGLDPLLITNQLVRRRTISCLHTSHWQLWEVVVNDESVESELCLHTYKYCMWLFGSKRECTIFHCVNLWLLTHAFHFELLLDDVSPSRFFISKDFQDNTRVPLYSEMEAQLVVKITSYKAWPLLSNYQISLTADMHLIYMYLFYRRFYGYLDLMQLSHCQAHCFLDSKLQKFLAGLSCQNPVQIPK